MKNQFEESLKEIRKELINIDMKNHNIFNYINFNKENNYLEISIRFYLYQMNYIFDLKIDEYDIKIIDSYNNNDLDEEKIYNLIINYIQFEDNIKILIELIYNYFYRYFKYINELD